MKIAIANDHAAVELKKQLIPFIESLGHDVVNLGTDSNDPYDYPLAGYKLALYVKEKKADFGIGICGTGIGISLACNKVKGIRAACVSDPVSAGLARNHNDANIICFGERIVGLELAKEIVKKFLETEFANQDRHIKRVNLISQIEERN